MPDGNRGERPRTNAVLLIAGVTATVVWQWTAPPTAQASPAGDGDAASGACDESEAGEHFQRGLELAADADYRAAIAKFEAAYGCQPHFAALYNIARAYLQLGENDQASRYLERYLREGGSNLSAEQVAAANEQLRQLREAETRDASPAAQAAQGASHVNVQCSTDGVTLLVDGNAAAQSPFLAPVEVESGRRQLLFRKQGHSQRARSYWLEPGEVRNVDCAFEPNAPSDGAATRVPPPQEPARDDRTVARGDSNVLAYVVGGVGLAAAGTATGIHLWNSDRFDEWEREDIALDAAREDEERGADEADALQRRQSANNDTWKSIRRYRDATLVIAAGAAAALSVSVYLFLNDDEGQSASVGWRGRQVVFEGVW